MRLLKKAIGNLRPRMQNTYKIKYRKFKMRDKTHYTVVGKEFPNGSHTTSHTWHLVEGYTEILNAYRIKRPKLMVNTGGEL